MKNKEHRFTELKMQPIFDLILLKDYLTFIQQTIVRTMFPTELDYIQH